MTHLIYYVNEKQKYHEAFERKFDYDRGTIITEKLIRHYKLRCLIEHTSGRNHNCFSPSRNSITLNSDNLNLLTICHEVAHALDYKRCRLKGIERKSWHNKRHTRLTGRIINYCTKKNYWEEELNRRLAPKPIKPEPTRIDLISKDIISLEKKIKRYSSVLKRYQNKLKKAEHSLKLKRKRLEVNSILEPILSS